LTSTFSDDCASAALESAQQTKRERIGRINLEPRDDRVVVASVDQAIGQDNLDSRRSFNPEPTATVTRRTAEDSEDDRRDSGAGFCLAGQDARR
jgi:hypothetical protein